MIRTLSLSLLLAVPAVAQWNLTPTATNPGEKSYPATAYDLNNANVVLFGGQSATGMSNETWLFDGANWSLATPTTSPPARREAAMAYDSTRGRVVLFGGRGASTELSDTWEWDGADWTQMSPAASPSRRQGHVMAFDSARNVTVLFGGSRNPDFCFPVSRETWEWNGTNWAQVTTANAPMNTVYGGMVYDVTRGVTVYYGGTDCGVTDTGTYYYDGTDWTDVSGAVGAGASNFAGISLSRFGMVYDPSNEVTILYGGRNEGVGGFSTGTWKFDGNSWARVDASSLSTRVGFGMAFDIANSTAVLYGGTNVAGQTVYFSETWEYACTTASFARFGTGCGGSGGPPPLLNSFGVPTLGAPFTLTYTGPNGITPVSTDRPYFLLGFSSLAVPVPQVTPLQPTNCTLYVDPILTVASPLDASGTRYVSDFVLNIPNELIYVGVPFFGQVATLYNRTTNNDTFIRFTNRADMVFGF